MTLKMFDTFIAEGTEMELALYTAILLDVLKQKHEHDQKQMDAEWLKQFGDPSLGDLMRREQEEDE